jgi:hypothetical protein
MAGSTVAKAHGDGPLASFLKRPPTDLTALAKAHGGVFPADLVARIRDGREPIQTEGAVVSR